MVPSDQPLPAACGRVLIVGGSSGIGLGLAQTLVRAGTEVTVVSRSGDRLAAAARSLGALDRSGTLVRTAAADISRESDVERLFQEAGPIQHVVTTAADGTGASGPIATISVEGALGFLGTKVLGPWLVAKHCARRLPAGGSLTFTSGIAAYRPSVSGSVVAAANGALESLAYALALELAPIRVNVVSPGWVDTPVWDTLAGVDRSSALAAMAHRLPAGRIGTPADLAQAYLAVLRNEFMTGAVLHVDGGHRLV
ncbi:short-chain dehydrogenase [Frankia sp. R43]|uniref:SDR family oxidoreductase n=1 Tax=Frankia sp. R43 TaxID=269536 RepID=UPI0006CA3F37|nr:short-chain dehydrogenase [Frankia sp. R43]